MDSRYAVKIAGTTTTARVRTGAVARRRAGKVYRVNNKYLRCTFLCTIMLKGLLCGLVV